ncbi:MAG: CPBP family intramembrane metalloprotease [Opitutae bacterium]|nr:CPBP family intramembrane metalloprotease [Opitutae bacterium]
MAKLMVVGTISLLFLLLGIIFVVARIFNLKSGEKIFSGTLAPWAPETPHVALFCLLLLLWMILFPTIGTSITRALFAETPLADNPICISAFSGAFSVAMFVLAKKFLPQSLPERFNMPTQRRLISWFVLGIGENLWSFFGFVMLALTLSLQLSALIPRLIPALEETWEKNQLIVDTLGNMEDKRLIFFAVPTLVILTPICEEIIFRAGIYRILKARVGAIAGGIITAIFFAALHDTAAGFFPLAILSCILSFAYERSGKIAVPIILHGIFNAFSIAQILLLQDVQLPDMNF